MKALVSIAVISFLTMGCGTEVPIGHVGMIIAPAGLESAVLQPGRHWVGPRSKLVLIEKQELKEKEALSILCKDDLNFSFDLIIRTRLQAQDVKGIADVLERQGSKVNEHGVLPAAVLYAKYVQPAARSVARSVVSRYETTQIRENRDSVQKAIAQKLIAAMKGTPMTIIAVYTSNFDYPDIITKAMERTKQRQVQIQEREAQKAMELMDAQARREVAEQEKATRVAEAQKEAAYNEIVAKSVTPQYIKLREIEMELQRIKAQKILYMNVGEGDKVIVTSGAGAVTMPIVQTAAAR